MIDRNHSRKLAVRRHGGCFHVPFLLPVLVTGVGLMLAGRVTAQTFTTLHSFAGGSDGGGPIAGLIVSTNTLYGTTSGGTVFRVNMDGSGFTNMYTFTATSINSSGAYTNSDGAVPNGLLLLGDTLYGTARAGGNSGQGTVFAVNTDGTGFTNLHGFTAFPSNYWTNSDGAGPQASLVSSGDTLYGTASGGGSGGSGTVFTLKTDGSGFAVLNDSFDSNLVEVSFWHFMGPLALSGNTLFGTAVFDDYAGGEGGGVFALNNDGTGFRFLFSSVQGHGNRTNSAGLVPVSVILSGNTLYGTAGLGGTNGRGTIFKLNTDGTGLAPLHSFTGGDDGGNPSTELVLSSYTLYGTALEGGSGGNGTVFRVNTDGTGFTTLHSFTAGSTDSLGELTNNDGAYPSATMVLSGDTLYGTTLNGGIDGNGTVFSISIPPELKFTPSGPNLVLSWPTNFTRYTLQSSTNLGLSVVWTSNSPLPVVVNGQNVVTNPISGTQQFFRLSQ